MFVHFDLKILDKVEKQGLIPSLKGVKVFILAVHTADKTEQAWESLRVYWFQYFKRSGAHVASYSIDRRWSNE